MIALREELERLEGQILAPYACKSAQSRGRVFPEEPCPLRTCFQRDRDRILHSKSFRRLKHKTQVLFLPEGDHYRTRLTHTLEVSQIARTIARALRLNEDLTEAIALGHDLGHTPFGHMGERVLDEICRENGIEEGFHHARQSLRVVDLLEKDGRGLNLTHEVREGILAHSKGQRDARVALVEAEVNPSTLEGWVVRISDSIAYLSHDLDDALRGGFFRLSDLPGLVVEVLGETHSARINSMVMDVVESSRPEEGKVTMSPGMLEVVESLRSFLYERLYMADFARREAPRIRHIIQSIFEYLVESEVLVDFSVKGVERVRRVVDFLAGMTDRFAVYFFEQRFIPKPWPLSLDLAAE